MDFDHQTAEQMGKEEFMKDAPAHGAPTFKQE